MKKIFSSIPVQVYWWNMGKKTSDMGSGNAYDYFDAKGIKVTKLLSKSKREGFRFKINVSSATVTLDIFDTPEMAAMAAIKTFLSLMGDKSIVTVGPRAYRMNWR